ncbi:MAG: hypothetical protein ACU0DX_00265 [Roseovarius sp.]|uniref:hypothetical protein n=1 Tax=Roseovarius sp. TaxID=1486281 RepID=UPI00260AD8DB|nr:hypothetical protein [Roseovarius sp.]
MADAVKRADVLEWDKTRTQAQQHTAGRKLEEATVSEIKKSRAALKKWADDETAAGMAEV